MGKKLKKVQAKAMTTGAKRSGNTKPPAATVVKKQNHSSAFSRSSKKKVLRSFNVDTTPLQLSNKSKCIKKAKKIANGKKVNSNSNNKKVADLKSKIALMNQKIKQVETRSKKNATPSIDKLAAAKPKQGSVVGKKLANASKAKSIKNDVSDSGSNSNQAKSRSKLRTFSKSTVKSKSTKLCASKPKNLSNEKLLCKTEKKSGPVQNQGRRKCDRNPTSEKDVPLKNGSKKSRTTRKRKLDPIEDSESVGQKVAYIHVGEGGERDLEDHLRGSSRVNIQILSTERLPDIDDSDMIHGLDHAGTSRDYVDERHRCTVRCPVGCQGHLRPNEIVIYESVRYDGRLLGRKRMKGRFVEGDVDDEDESVVALEMTDFRRIGGRSNRRFMNERNQRRRMLTQRYRRAMEEDRNDSPIPPEPEKIGVRTGLPQRISILLDNTPVSREEAVEHSWNPNDRSFNVVLKEDDPLIMRRHPVAQSTDCIRSKIGYASGLHIWEISWPIRQRGTHAVIGVATREAALHSVGYQSLVGNTDQSWGWDLGRKKAYHNSRANEGIFYPSTITHHHQWTVPDDFHMILDMDSGYLGFVVGDEFLGWSHSNIRKGERVFAMVSTVWGHCEVKLRYLGGLDGGVVDLQELTRGAIRNAIGRSELENQVEQLSLPTKLKNYLKE